MVGEERTPLLSGQVIRHELQVHGLQGHGQVGSDGQETGVARGWLPWAVLALAVLAGVSAGLKVVHSTAAGPTAEYFSYFRTHFGSFVQDKSFTTIL